MSLARFHIHMMGFEDGWVSGLCDLDLLSKVNHDELQCDSWQVPYICKICRCKLLYDWRCAAILMSTLIVTFF